MNRYLLIDGPNITHAANNTKKLTVGDVQVQAVYQFLQILRRIQSVYASYTPIVLWDGASWRRMAYPEYKANRDKPATSQIEIQQKEAREQAQKQMPAIKKALELLGVTQIKAANMEADDLAAIVGDRYAAKGAKIVLVSGDKDWVQLVNDNIIWFDPIVDRKIRKWEDINEALGYDLKGFQQFLEMKCLFGDSGDNIPGVGGVGEKGAIDFLNQYGSLANFSNMCIDGSLDLKKVPKKYRNLVEDEDRRIKFAFNMKLMDLRTTQRPDPLNLAVNKGTPDIQRFENFCNRFLFKSITKNLTVWASVFPALHELQQELAA
jgi:5'-3' exonuclease